MWGVKSGCATKLWIRCCVLVDHSGMMSTKVQLVQEDNYAVLCIWISYEQLEICTMHRKPYTSK
jgi:hypothetical protein